MSAASRPPESDSGRLSSVSTLKIQRSSTCVSITIRLLLSVSSIRFSRFSGPSRPLRPRGFPQRARRYFTPRMPSRQGLFSKKSEGEEKGRPPRARRPILPRADPAVLSAMGGLTAEFGMGSGDPRLRGRAHAGRFAPRLCRSQGPRLPWRPHSDRLARESLERPARKGGCREVKSSAD